MEERGRVAAPPQEPVKTSTWSLPLLVHRVDLDGERARSDTPAAVGEACAASGAVAEAGAATLVPKAEAPTVPSTRMRRDLRSRAHDKAPLLFHATDTRPHRPPIAENPVRAVGAVGVVEPFGLVAVCAGHRTAAFYPLCCRRTISSIQTGANGEVQPGGVG